MIKVPFNRPYATGQEFEFIQQAIDAGQLSGNGAFTQRCQVRLREMTGAKKVLLTHSGTAALEMCSLLTEVGPGDEVIMPSYTFVSTANAVVLRGATPVFVDVEPTTLNLDPALAEAAVTPQTKSICVVHYAGVAATMEPLVELCRRKGLALIEDAAQGAMARYRGQALGSIGHLGAISFHETKNLISGEGGALPVNDDALAERAEILWEKGTNRSAFFRGEVDKYTWVDVGSSFLPGELMAAFLWAQLQHAEQITAARMMIWTRYHDAFETLERSGRARRPRVPEGREHNAHMYYLICDSPEARGRLIQRLKAEGYLAVFHYVPLHSSPGGRRYGRTHGSMSATVSLSERLIRLPLWVGLGTADADRVVELVYDELKA